MNAFRNIKETALLALAGLISVTTSAQLTVDVNMDPNQMVQNLVGDGVQIFNVQVTAADSSYGYYYSNGTEIGNSQGLLLSTGLATKAVGPNNSTGLPLLCGLNCCVNCELYDNHFGGSDLLDEAQDRETFDACMIEFDIVPQGDSLRFSYTFASEEYLEWVGSPFNDVFGFFITGPNVGIDVNVALVPGTSEAVAINNVNNIDNSSYFYNNQSPPGQFIQYDGFTVDLAAAVGNLIPCQTYHLKLIIGDGSDRLYDSAVFVNAIESNPVVVLTATAGGIDDMVEGCNAGTITFATDGPVSSDYDVTYWIGGNATNGVDYLPTLGNGINGDPITITIPAGESSVSVDIQPVADGLTEGQECMVIYLANPLCNSVEAFDSVTFCIQDLLDVTVSADDSNLCVGECTTLHGSAITQGSATFSWSPLDGMVNEDSLNPTVCPSATTTYVLTSEVASCTDSAEITIVVSDLDLEFDVDNVQCAGGNTGCIDLIITGGIEPYSIQWTGPDGYVATTEDICGLAPGQYCATVTDAFGCQLGDCVTLVQTNELGISDVVFSQYSCSAISCPGACDASIDITVTGGVFPYSYAWSNGENTEDISSLCAGDYTVTVTDDVGCVFIQTFTVDEPQPLVLALDGVVEVQCNGTQTGSICVDASGGCAPYFFTWSHDASLHTPCAGSLATGTYTVTVSDANGCSIQDGLEIVVGGPLAPLAIVVDAVSLYPGGYNTSCPGTSDGWTDVTISGGTFPYTFAWYDNDNVLFSSSEDLVDAPCGNYTLVVTDANDCTSSVDINLVCVPAMNVTVAIVPNPCGNETAGLGAVDVLTTSGGNGGPYSYSWSGPSCNTCSTEDISGLNSGSYTLTLTDGQGCTAVFTFNVGTNDAFTATGSVSDASCFGICDGAIDLNLIPPGGSYTYDWQGPNGFTASSEDISGLCSGVYSVTVSASGCSGSFYFGVGEPGEINISVANVVQPVCYGQNDGSIDINVSGGAGSLDYSWTANTGCVFFGANTQDINNLFECCYTVVVTDDNNCTSTETVCLDAPDVMDIFVSTSSYNGGFEISCNGESDGSISVTVSGGTPDCSTFAPECYFFDWSNCDDISPNDANASYLQNLEAGVFCVNVTDANGCLATTTINLDEPTPITSPAVVTPVTCNGSCNGSITPNLSGSSGVYTSYNWNAGASIGANAPNAATLTALCAGTYILTVTDSYGCSETFTYVITENPALQLTITNVQDETCAGTCDGALAFTISGGLPSYVITITDGNGNAYFGQSLFGLCSGTYTILVLDAAGCSQSASITISGAPALTGTLSILLQNSEQIYSIQCYGDCTGAISSEITGGSGTLDYLWTEGKGEVIGTEADISDLCAGYYCLEVTDEGGCSFYDCIEVTQPDQALLASAEISTYNGGFNISCPGACDGWLDVTVSGGVPGYVFNWNSDVGTFPDVEDLSDLCAGVYEVLVTDANFCSALLPFELTEPNPITINPVVSNYTGFGVSCFDSCNGTIDITPNGGYGELNVDWTNLGTNATSLADLCAGDYEVCITDELECQHCQTITVTSPELLVVDISGAADCDGTAPLCAMISGGVGPYTVMWSTTETTACIVLVSEGEVCVTVTDANGCTAEACITIDLPTPISGILDVTSTTCGQCNATMEIIVSGGLPPYNYDWTGSGTTDGSALQTDLCPGTYSVLVTDQNGCTVNASFTIPNENPILVETDIQNIPCNGGSSGSISVTFINAADPVELLWTDIDGNELGTTDSLENLPAGDYQLAWSDDEGCSGTETFTLNEPSAIEVDAVVSLYDGDFNISTLAGTDGWIVVEVSGGSPGYSYEWDPPTGNDTTTTYLNLPAGSYSLTVTDANGCQADLVFVLTGPDELDLPTGLTPNGDNLNDSYVIIGAEAFPGNSFKVFNRWGNLVYELGNYSDQWHGQNSDNDDLPDGTYYVVFETSSKSFSTYVDLRR